MSQAENSDGITLGELGRRMDSFQSNVSSSIQVLTDKLDDRPSHKDLADAKDTLRREIAMETATRVTSEGVTSAALKSLQDSARYNARTAASAIVTTVLSVLAAVLVFFLTK